MTRPILVSTIPHLPSFDVTFPVLARLQSRGRVDVRCFVGRHLLRTEPRVRDSISSSGVDARFTGVIGLELGALAMIARADAVFAHVDPHANFKRSRPRDTVIPALSRAHIYIQHGMFQYYLNYQWEERVQSYYSDTLLVWDSLPADVDRFVTGDPVARSKVVGFPKKNLLGPFSGVTAIEDALDGYSRRVLICHNFGWELKHNADGQQGKALAMLEELFRANPDTAFILRSHRGRSGRSRQGFDDVLARHCPNALISDRHEGAFRYSTIHDVMEHCDAVITHPSTTILDAAYRGLPVGIVGFDAPALAGNADKIAHMPMVDRLEDAQDFLDRPGPAREAMGTLFRRYGSSIDDNLDRAAAAIETRLGA